MNELSLHEARILGALIEKEHTTPDSYPLSLNALTVACNQKSNRDPVLTLSQDEVQNCVDDLVKKRLVINDENTGSRSAKIRHRFCNTEFSKWTFSPQQLAIITILFLRGPQTPGELRTRTNRLCHFSDVHEVESVLTELIIHERHPFVIKLAREPGQSACRYAHLFSGPVTLAVSNSPSPENVINSVGNDASDRLDSLEQEVAELKAQLAELQDNMALLLD
ncbi:MAG: hypothetical protein ACI86X_001358 [Moritella sp.]|jgi:uncharacterized protein YceH (UPF0502 family)